MRRQLTRHPAFWAGLPALVGAVAALALPGNTSAATAEAALLAVGALALLAGHTWGLLVALTSHVPLVGRLWPSFAAASGADGGGGDSSVAAAIAIVLVTALPVVVLSGLLLPRIVEHLLPGQSPRLQSGCVAVTAFGLAASLVLPAL